MPLSEGWHKMRKRPENDIQRSIVKYIEAVVPSALVMAIPNASRRTKSGRPMNAAPGLLPGAPDLVVVIPKGKVIWIEVKAPKGTVSSNQKMVHGRLRSLGHMCFVVRSIEDVQRVFDSIGIETRDISLLRKLTEEMDGCDGGEDEGTGEGWE